MKTETKTFRALKLSAMFLGSAFGYSRKRYAATSDHLYDGMQFQAWLNLRSFFSAVTGAKLSRNQIRTLAVAARECCLRDSA